MDLHSLKDLLTERAFALRKQFRELFLAKSGEAGTVVMRIGFTTVFLLNFCTILKIMV